MKFLFMLASFWLFSFSGYSQNFNTVLHISKPSGVRLAPKQSAIKQDSVIQPIINNIRVDTISQLSERDIHLLASMPLRDISKLTSGFGNRTHPVTGERNKFHSGIDISAKSDTVFSILPGIIEESGYNQILGNYVRIKHGDVTSIYGHLLTRFVLNDESVTAGSAIGITGQTGRVTGEHLHFTIKYRNGYLNPLTFLAKLVTVQARNQFIAANSKSITYEKAK
jgi:murein DD-endopeptidase MepM/ murein hydrolase activator NlpD